MQKIKKIVESEVIEIDANHLVKNGISEDEIIKKTLEAIGKDTVFNGNYYDKIYHKIDDLIGDEKIDEAVLEQFAKADVKELEDFVTVMSETINYYDTPKYSDKLQYVVDAAFDIEKFAEYVQHFENAEKDR